MHSSRFDRFDNDSRFFSVKSDACRFQFLCQFFLLFFAFLCVEDHQNKICGLSNRDNLSSTTFTIGGALNNSRQIKQLHFSIVNEKFARDARECGEFVRSSLRLLLSDKVEEGGLADGGEPDHGNASVTVL